MPSVDTLNEQAHWALQLSDVVVLRQLEQGKTIPPEWITYRSQLRQVLQGALTALPARPPYPS